MLSRHGVIDKPGRAEEQEQLKSRIELDNEIEEIKRRQQQQVMMMVRVMMEVVVRLMVVFVVVVMMMVTY